MFADGLRDYTQPILYNLTADQIDVRSKLALKYIDWDIFNDYFHFIQKRFRNHYDILNYLRKHKIRPQDYYKERHELCERNPLFHRKRAASAEGGILALKRLRRDKVYIGGLPPADIPKVAAKILKWLNVPFTLSATINLDTAVGMLVHLRNGSIKEDGSIYWNTSGTHETGFLKMKGQWHYYDNEFGLVKADRVVIEDLLDSNVFMAIRGKLYIMKGTPTHPTHVWKNGKWDTDIGTIIQKNTGIMSPYRSDCLGIHAEDVQYNLKQCKFPLKASDPVTTMKKIVECIQTNTDSNSSIFEDLYHYMYENLDAIQDDRELFTSLVATLQTIVERPACTPLIHYWVFKINAALAKMKFSPHAWFNTATPVLKSRGLPGSYKPTPPERRKELAEERKEYERRQELIEQGIDPDKMKVSPCPPGQVRDAKTKKCRDRAKRPTPPKKNSANANTRKKREKVSPCPPGQVRDAKTKKCRERFAKKSPCPPGQVRDKKTQKCRDAKKYKLHK